jgi:multiple sugar transport system substrate-binding protein
MVKALAALADLHKSGAMPRNMNAMNNEEITTWIQQGRVAMTINPFARVVSYNDPATSRAPGRIKAAAMPMAADLVGKVPYAATTEYWSYAIPRNSRNKELAWTLIRALSAKTGTLGMAFANGLPHAALEAQALKDARIHLPAFDNQARAHDVFVEESQAVMLGMKPADRAMADAERRVKAML